MKTQRRMPSPPAQAPSREQRRGRDRRARHQGRRRRARRRRRSRRARTFCQELFERLGAEVTVEVKETPEAIGVSLTAREGNTLELSGALVEAVQHLVNRVVNPRAEGRKWVNLDVGGLPRGGRPGGEGHGGAARGGRRADRQGARHRAHQRPRAPADPPRPASTRRSVSTRSEGEGLFRQLLIVPVAARGEAPSGAARRRRRSGSSRPRCCGARSSCRTASTARASGSSTRACCATSGSRTPRCEEYLAAHRDEVEAAIGRRGRRGRGTPSWTPRFRETLAARRRGPRARPVAPGRAPPLERYADRLLAWNRKVNLTAITAPAEVAEKHLVDSLLLLPLARRGRGRCSTSAAGPGSPGSRSPAPGRARR